MAKAKSTAASQEDFLATLNELNKVANRTNIANVQAKSMERRRGTAATKAAAEPANVCAVYLKARPILELIIRLPLIPQKAKDIIRALMAGLDVLCPVK